MRSPLRVAIGGTGFMGRVHARSARLAGAEVVAVAASTPDRGRAAAAEPDATDAVLDAAAAHGWRDVDATEVPA
jgi:predicted dehydrogenase